MKAPYSVRFFESGPLLLQQDPTRQNDISTLLVELDDFEAMALSKQIVEVSHRPQVDLRSRQEGLHPSANGHRQAALDSGGDGPFDQLIALAGGRNLIPHLETVRLFLGNNAEAIGIFPALEEHVDDVPDFDCHLSIDHELGGSNGAFRLVADVDDNVVLAEVDDLTLDDFAFLHLVALERLLEKRGKIFFHVRGGIRRRRHSNHEYPLCL